jgi:subtilisin family serine protease
VVALVPERALTRFLAGVRLGAQARPGASLDAGRAQYVRQNVETSALARVPGLMYPRLGFTRRNELGVLMWTRRRARVFWAASLVSALFLVSSMVGDVTVWAAGSLRTSVMADGHQARASDSVSGKEAQAADNDASAQKNEKMAGDLTLLSTASRGNAEAAVATARVRDAATAGDRVQVVVEGAGSERSGARAAIQSAGGDVQAEYQNLVQASVPVASLGRIANDSSVGYVRRPLHGFPDAVSGEGVAASGASTWQTAGLTGSGAKIAVIDFGFTGYQARQASGDLPANLIAKDLCGGAFNVSGGEHGTAVGEVVYEMAPGAQLYLICVDTEVDLGLAKDYAKAQGINVIVHSASWFNTSRGDGTGTPSSPNATVADARNSGILWVNSAGNRAQQHWSGTFRDEDNNGLNNFNNPGETPDNGNTVFLFVNQQICVYLRWDAWPTTNIDYDLRLTTSSAGTLVAQSATLQNGTQPPTESFCYTNTTGSSQNFAIGIKKANAPTSPLLELFVAPAPDLEWQTAAGSITEPASSPNAFAAAAVCWQNSRLEDYSSRGPTIDGRIKPDIAGQSVVSSATYGPWTSCPADSIGTGNVSFNGTSAAAPHVAGAAALVKGAFPSFTASQIQAFLEGRAIDKGEPGKDNSFGAGVLALGAPSAVTAPPPSAQCRTTLSADLPAGATVLPVASQQGCQIGDHIAINPGGSTEERSVISGFGSIIIDQPTKNLHRAGEAVVRIAVTEDLGRAVVPPEDDTDKPRKETEEQRQQRERTNASNRDDEHTEGNVMAVKCDADWPTITIANRDGLVDVRLVHDAVESCSSAREGDYLEADGEKQNEQLYDASDITLHRDGQRVR